MPIFKFCPFPLFIISQPVFSEALTGRIPQERIAVVNFSILDDEGNFLDSLITGIADLVILTRSMSLGVASRFIQFGYFPFLDQGFLKEEIEFIPFPTDIPSFEQVLILLTQYGFDQAITGSIAPMQNLVIIGAQPFDLQESKPCILGSTMTTVPRTIDLPTQIGLLPTQLFPPGIPDIENPINQGFVFRFTAGLQAYSLSRLTFPVEGILDMIIPTSGGIRPSFRLGVNLGIDLFP